MNPKRKIAIIPYPKSLKLTGGQFTLTQYANIISDSSITGLDSIISFLKEKIESTIGFLLPEKDKLSLKGGKAIRFAIENIDLPAKNEAYTLSVKKDEINVTAQTVNGLFYGMISLFQILYSAYDKAYFSKTKHLKVPCMEISDSPRFSWRGLLLDCSRHFITKKLIKIIIDILALYKMNKFHWHLVDDQGWRIEIKKYPKLAEIGAWRGKAEKRYGGYYTQEDVLEIITYAQSRFVEIVPEIEIPGHSVAALAAYPEYSCTGGPFEVETRWGIFEDVYCAGNEQTFGFLSSILDEVCSLFPSDFIHLGGDEVPISRWTACPKCRLLMKQKDMHKESELQHFLLERTSRHLRTMGKKAICWDEVTESDAIPGMIVQYWRAFVNDDILTRAVKRGHSVIVSPTSHCYLDYPTSRIDTKKIYSLEPVPEGLSPDEEKQIIGVECNMWTEHAPQEWVLEKILPRLIGLSEVGWTPKSDKNFDELMERLHPQMKLLGDMGVAPGEPFAPDFSQPVKLKIPATIETNMGTYEQYSPERAFDRSKKNSFYWSGRPVKKNETFSLVLRKQLLCRHIRITTKCADIADNILENGIVEISADEKTFTKIADFKDGIADAWIENQAVKTLRITATEDQESWVAICDIFIE